MNLESAECDDGFLARLRAGDDAAFEEFVAMWSLRFERDLKHRGFSPADAWDLGFSCATQVLIKLDSYRRGTDGFDGWVLTVGRHFASDWRRRNHRVSFVPLSPTTPAAEPESVPDEQRNPQVPEALKLAFSKLNPADRKLIEMRHLDGSCGFDEIAQSLGISVTAARVRHHRLMIRLRKKLDSILGTKDPM